MHRNESCLRSAFGCNLLIALTILPVVWLAVVWTRNAEARMNRNHLERCMDTRQASASDAESPFVSLEAEIPEVLYRGMKAFIGSNPAWDQYQLMSSALAQFLFQNGCSERAVTERYLDDLFSRSQA